MDNKKWLSLHIFYYDISRQDALIKKCISPLFKKLSEHSYVNSYFFIRYWEGGPHIRLRVNVNKDYYKQTKDYIESYVYNYLVKYPSDVQLNREEYYRNILMDSQLEQIDTNIYKDNLIISKKYKLEVNRYGGINGIAIAQNLFMVSSQLVGELLSRINSKEQKLAIALNLMIVSYLAFSKDNEKAINFFKGYSKYYNVYTRNDKEGLLVNKAIQTSFYNNEDRYRQQIQLFIRYFIRDCGDVPNFYKTWFNVYKLTFRNLYDLYNKGNLIDPLSGNKVEKSNYNKAVQLILHSYMHMNNNRLGINIFEESYLGYIIYKSLKNS